MSISFERIKNKLCVVTGAAQSVGFDIAKRYAECGAVVAMMDVNPLVEKSAASLQGLGMKAIGIILDVTNEMAVKNCFDKLIMEYGPVFALVNAAGIMEISSFEEVTMARWRKVIEINLFGTVHCIRGAIGSMREHGEGKIINFASKAGKTGSKLMSVYGASKGAIITMTQALAQEYAQHHININCLCPDIIDDSGVWAQANRMYSENLKMSPEDVRVLYMNKVPLGRFVTKEEISDMVLFYTICADDCTGQSINITGGRFMH